MRRDVNVVLSGILVAIVACLALLASAEDTVDTEAVKTLVAACAACHGADGNSAIPGYPNIGGQNAKYLEHQMKLMRSGERAIALMAGQLDNMSDQDLKNIAAFYASQPTVVGQAKDEKLELGESIYRGGILKKNVAACTACHSPNGNGNALAGFPRIAGQPVEYTVTQLKAYRERERTSDENVTGMMRDIASNLTDTEMKAVANYIRGLY